MQQSAETPTYKTEILKLSSIYIYMSICIPNTVSRTNTCTRCCTRRAGIFLILRYY